MANASGLVKSLLWAEDRARPFQIQKGEDPEDPQGDPGGGAGAEVGAVDLAAATAEDHDASLLVGMTVVPLLVVTIHPGAGKIAGIGIMAASMMHVALHHGGMIVATGAVTVVATEVVTVVVVVVVIEIVLTAVVSAVVIAVVTVVVTEVVTVAPLHRGLVMTAGIDDPWRGSVLEAQSMPMLVTSCQLGVGLVSVRLRLADLARHHRLQLQPQAVRKKQSQHTKRRRLWSKMQKMISQRQRRRKQLLGKHGRS